MNLSTYRGMPWPVRHGAKPRPAYSIHYKTPSGHVFESIVAAKWSWVALWRFLDTRPGVHVLSVTKANEGEPTK